MSEEIDKATFMKAVIETAKNHNLRVVVAVEDAEGLQSAAYGNPKDVLALMGHLQVCISKDPDVFTQP